MERIHGHLLPFTLLLLILSSFLLIHGNSLHSRERKQRRIRNAQAYLQSINKAAVKSIKSPDGDIIDCVKRDKQPTLAHPLFTTHQLQEPPLALIPGLKRVSPLSSEEATLSPRAKQLWQLQGEACPKGTIPIRRTRLNDLLRSPQSPMSYGKKKKKKKKKKKDKEESAYHPQSLHNSTTASLLPQADAHEHAIAYVKGGEYYGAKAVLNVWAPSVEIKSSEFSLSQLWVLGGSFSADLNSIEAGWQVSPELYGDGQPRLFTYWTSDAYQETGCYNLLCSGFIQTSDSIAIGASIAPVSVYGGNQYQIEILVWKDPREGNWWMVFDQDTIVGYWPSALFTHLKDHAIMVEWGGEVVNSRPNGAHTATQMGSGRLAEEGFGGASFFHSLQVVDANNDLQPVDSIHTLAEHPNCYDVKSVDDPHWGLMFYYGGPGRNPLCP